MRNDSPNNTYHKPLMMDEFCGGMDFGKSDRNGASGPSDIEGKAARVAANECGQRVSFNRGGPGSTFSKTTTASVQSFAAGGNVHELRSDI